MIKYTKFINILAPFLRKYQYIKNKHYHLTNPRPFIFDSIRNQFTIDKQLYKYKKNQRIKEFMEKTQ